MSERLERMSANLVKGEGLQVQLEKVLMSYSDEVAEDIAEEIQSVGKEALKIVKEKSPKNTGTYRKGWRLKVNKGRIGTQIIIYNANKPQLTHLLENGHAKADGNDTVDGIPHIYPANEWAEKEIMQRIERRLNE